MVLYAIAARIMSCATIVPTTKLENSLSSGPNSNWRMAKHKSATRINRLLLKIAQRLENARGAAKINEIAGTRLVWSSVSHMS